MDNSIKFKNFLEPIIIDTNERYLYQDICLSSICVAIGDNGIIPRS